VSDFSREKELAAELSKLREQMRKLHDEIRGGALPSKPPSGPTLPTEPERRLRPMTPTTRPDPEDIE
jgi:hypothetical protein